MCQNNEAEANIKKEEDKHEEFFFDDYNEAYNLESSNASTSILPFKNPEYFKNKIDNRETTKNRKQKNITSWTLDSGTSYHMTGNLEILDDVQECNSKIRFANGDHVVAEGIGTYHGYINDNKIKLKNVLYIPVFRKNLISVDGLSDQNLKTVFYRNQNRNYASVYNSKNNRICTTYSNNSKTYNIWTSKRKIEFNKEKSSDATCNSLTQDENDNLYMWHRRLGHYNLGPLRSKLSKIDIKCRCKICAKSKLKNFPHHPCENKTTEPFELIHMDTVTIKNESLYGNKYFISILDDYTRYGWVLFIKSKDEVFENFLNWYKIIKNIFGKSIKYLRTDNGTEFTNNKILNFCNENGIIHEFSVPYDPQQNGKIERLHGSLLPNARAMLEDAHLNHVYWEDAIDTANYVLNRIPHRGIDKSSL